MRHSGSQKQTPDAAPGSRLPPCVSPSVFAVLKLIPKEGACFYGTEMTVAGFVKTKTTKVLMSLLTGAVTHGNTQWKKIYPKCQTGDWFAGLLEFKRLCFFQGHLPVTWRLNRGSRGARSQTVNQRPACADARPHDGGVDVGSSQVST